MKMKLKKPDITIKLKENVKAKGPRIDFSKLA